MNITNLVCSVILSAAIIVGAYIHAEITKIEYMVSVGNSISDLALTNTKSGDVWLLCNRENRHVFKDEFQFWFRVPDTEWTPKKQ
jgi:hypothetical protein